MAQNVSLTSSGPPETRIPLDPPEVLHLVSQVRAGPSGPRAMSIADQLVRLAPRSSLVWWACGLVAATERERYAAFRVGYHRGLDTLRANGWRGSGYVRWSHEGNLGFLRCLHGLQQSARAIGEVDEDERCGLFLLQLDPGGVPATEPGLPELK